VRSGELRAVVDTNVWVSAVINPIGAPAQVLAALRAGRFDLVVSTPLLVELADVLARPRLMRRHGIMPDGISHFIEALREIGIEVSISGDVHVCRDPDDDAVIETALVGRADVLVTRDDDLKRAPEVAAVLAEAGIEVLSVQRFLDHLDEAQKSSQSGDALVQEVERDKTDR
jgi:putative PIN family toxin of toxin-antitoxin system